jgi:hypothetical protein
MLEGQRQGRSFKSVEVVESESKGTFIQTYDGWEY